MQILSIRKMRKILKNIIVVLLFLLLCGCNHKQTEDIIILYTNDVACELNGEIGYAGVKGYKDHLLSEHKYVSLVDAGDYFDGDIAQVSGGKYIVDIMNAVGYDVVTLGNQEFSIGLDALSKSIKDSNFNYVSCNIKYVGPGKNPLKSVKPYVIKKYGWTKIAFIGVTTPETLTEGKQAYEAIVKDGNLLYDFYGTDYGEELYDQVQKTVDSVRKKVDYVIVLAHLGMNNVAKGMSSYELIANTTGIDVVIDAHSHTPNTGEPVDNKDGEMVVLTSTGQKINYLGVLEIHPNHTYTTVLYPSTYYTDEGVQALIDDIYKEIGN